MKLLMAIIDQREAKAAQKAEQEAKLAAEVAAKEAKLREYEASAWAGLPKGLSLGSITAKPASPRSQTAGDLLKKYYDMLATSDRRQMTSGEFNEQCLATPTKVEWGTADYAKQMSSRILDDIVNSRLGGSFI